MLVSRWQQSSCLSVGTMCMLHHDQRNKELVGLGFLAGQQEDLRTECQSVVVGEGSGERVGLWEVTFSKPLGHANLESRGSLEWHKQNPDLVGSLGPMADSVPFGIEANSTPPLEPSHLHCEGL